MQISFEVPDGRKFVWEMPETVEAALEDRLERLSDKQIDDVASEWHCFLTSTLLPAAVAQAEQIALRCAADSGPSFSMHAAALSEYFPQ